AAFRATLEEVAGADLLLHVIDAASPDQARHMDAVAAVLGEVGAGRVPVLGVARISVTFPTNGDGSRERVAELYRVGRIVRHVASDDEVSIEAEIPPRLVPRVHEWRRTPV